jgi:glucose/arabinose dehydrogenase
MAVLYAAGLSLSAQGTPPTAPATPAQGPARGQGAGRGGGGFPGGGFGQNNAGADFAPKDPIQPRTPADEAASFMLPTGYRLELVASDPVINNPVAIAFDGDGRMYVAEMRTYMMDADGTHEHDPESRITRFESTKGDGVYDKHTVFVDHLVLPRMVLPLDNNSILVNETDSDDVVQYWDTDNDGVSDRKQVFYTGVGKGRDGNLEHEQSGFVWGLDNWIYSTYNAFRFRWTPNGILKESTGPNSGQWGLAEDDDGKTWWVDAGGERGPQNFQVPIQYGAFSAPDQFEPGFEVVWPAPGIGDMQGGMGRIRMPVANLNHFTAAAGPQIVRGDRLPEDLRGDLLFTEPVGRLVRRAKIVKDEGLTQLRNAYPGSEFIVSRDPLFRPVNLKTAPDGTVYLVDMYHGIIQESQWSGPGSYLRTKIEQYQLDKVTSYGRIWRLRFDGTPGRAATAASPERPGVPGIPLDLTQPRMLEETAAQLVTHLTHPNGWWRDMAQRLLVLKQDESLTPASHYAVRTTVIVVGRADDLWCL